MADESADRRATYTVQILSRAVNVLHTLASRNRGWSLDELSEHLSINKASLLRILQTLVNEHLVLRSDDAYTLGPRVLDLSHGYLRSLELDAVARPYLETLASRTGQTISLAILDGLEIVYIAIERAQQQVGIQGEIGARHPANATALGKVLLADLEASTLDALLEDQELPRLTHRTIHLPNVLKRHLTLVREQGFAIDDEERGIGIRCIAAPIRRQDGRVIAALSIAGPIFHMTDDVMPSYREWLLEATTAISERFGYQSPVEVT